MKNLIFKVINKYKSPNRIQLEVEKLKVEINSIYDQIDKTDMWFECERNVDLIDACIYQREFLNARYRYLLKKIKKLYSEKNFISLGRGKNDNL